MPVISSVVHVLVASIMPSTNANGQICPTDMDLEFCCFPVVPGESCVWVDGYGTGCPAGENPYSNAEDWDQDCILDTDERRYLNLFAPIYYTDEVTGPFQGDVGVPVEVAWAVRHSVFRVCMDDGDGNLIDPDDYPIVMQGQVLDETFLEWLDTQLDCGKLLRMDLLQQNGLINPDNHEDPENRTWEEASRSGNGRYGRVWRPWPDTHPNLLSVQYFLYTTWNETSAADDVGNHEGDWACVDFTIDTGVNPEFPSIVNAIFHNHGRQIFVTPEALVFEDNRPVVFAERGTNELWPQPGGDGSLGWPTTNGWALNHVHNGDPVFGFGDEGDVVREHRGLGHRFDFATTLIENIGDNTRSLTSNPLEGLFIQKYTGLWGHNRYGNVFYSAAAPPRSPFYQAKMRRRTWYRDNGHGGPWAPENDPWVATNGFVPAHRPDTDWYLPAPSPVVHVSPIAPDAGRGTAARPYRQLGLALSMVEHGGRVVLAPGSYQQLSPGFFEDQLPLWDIPKQVEISIPIGEAIIE